VAADAPPFITWVVGRTCFVSITIEVSAAIVTASKRSTVEPDAPKERVNVPEEAAVLVTTILVITVVVDAGTVYNRVPTLVVAAPLNNTFAVFAIYFSFLAIPLGSIIHY